MEGGYGRKTGVRLRGSTRMREEKLRSARPESPGRSPLRRLSLVSSSSMPFTTPTTSTSFTTTTLLTTLTMTM